MKEYISDNIGYISLVDQSNSDILLKTVNAARVSHLRKSETFTEKDKKLFNYLWTEEHTSPFRHSWFTFEIKAPIFVFRQWMKYQVGSTWRSYEANGEDIVIEMFDHFYDSDKGCSWNEASGRYAEFEPEFYIPNTFRSNVGHNKQASETTSDWTPEKNSIWKTEYRIFYANAYNKYKHAIAAGIAKELARLLLPISIYTYAYWTVSLQGILHFLNQRLKSDAQFEIREFAILIERLINTDLEKSGILINRKL